jgi:ArsR family transcriptional regulator, arsenate/arsenite/antimonite-responsive transcriptional repressor
MAEPAVKPAQSLASVEQVYRALADGTRLRILHLLNEGPLCVGDLVSVLRIPQPTASRHLAYLRRSGLVIDERRGQWSFYKLAPAGSPFHRSVLASLEAAESKQTREDDLALRSLRRAGGCCPQHERPTRSRSDGHRRS